MRLVKKIPQELNSKRDMCLPIFEKSKIVECPPNDPRDKDKGETIPSHLAQKLQIPL